MAIYRLKPWVDISLRSMPPNAKHHTGLSFNIHGYVRQECKFGIPQEQSRGDFFVVR